VHQFSAAPADFCFILIDFNALLAACLTFSG
jgi:hypothetical protein